MDSFLKKFFPKVYNKKHQKSSDEDNYYKYDNQGLIVFTSSLYLAGLVVSLAASPVTHCHGRHASIVDGGVSFLTGATLNAVVENLPMLLLNRILLGVGICFGNQAVPQYLSEMALTHLRSDLNMMFQLATTLDIFSINMINYSTEKLRPWGWHLSLSLATTPAFLMTVRGLLLSETPNILIERGLHDEGSCMLEKIRGTSNVVAELKDIAEASKLANPVEAPFRSMLERRNRLQLVMAVMMSAFQILNGINSILFYAPMLLHNMGFGGNVALYSSIMTGTVLALSTVVSIALLDRC